MPIHSFTIGRLIGNYKMGVFVEPRTFYIRDLGHSMLCFHFKTLPFSSDADYTSVKKYNKSR